MSKTNTASNMTERQCHACRSTFQTPGDEHPLRAYAPKVGYVARHADPRENVPVCSPKCQDAATRGLRLCGYRYCSGTFAPARNTSYCPKNKCGARENAAQAFDDAVRLAGLPTYDDLTRATESARAETTDLTAHIAELEAELALWREHATPEVTTAVADARADARIESYAVRLAETWGLDLSRWADLLATEHAEMIGRPAIASRVADEVATLPLFGLNVADIDRDAFLRFVSTSVLSRLGLPLPWPPMTADERHSGIAGLHHDWAEEMTRPVVASVTEPNLEPIESDTIEEPEPVVVASPADDAALFDEAAEALTSHKANEGTLMGAFIDVRNRFEDWESDSSRPWAHLLPKRFGGPWPDGSSPVENDSASPLLHADSVWRTIEHASAITDDEYTASDDLEVTSR